jgi:hypothetical protein
MRLNTVISLGTFVSVMRLTRGGTALPDSSEGLSLVVNEGTAEAMDLDQELSQLVSDLLQVSQAPIGSESPLAGTLLELRLGELHERIDQIPASPKTSAFKSVIRLCQMGARSSSPSDMELLSDLVRFQSLSPLLPTDEDIPLSPKGIQRRVLDVIKSGESNRRIIDSIERRRERDLGRHYQQFFGMREYCDLLAPVAAEAGFAASLNLLKEVIADAHQLVSRELKGDRVPAGNFRSALERLNALPADIFADHNVDLDTVMTVFREQLDRLTNTMERYENAYLAAAETERKVNEYIQLVQTFVQIDDAELADAIKKWTRFL